ncbi:MAG: GTPase ObgE [Metamycoplasmataceae bacterium]
MKFIDEIKLDIKAGNGGNGIISFRREARVEKGGPDGGDGGYGGNIYFQGDTGINTLFHLYNMKKIIGQDGENGMSKNMYGAKGKDTVIKVPLGTLVYDENSSLICDVIDDNKYLIAKGGKGGFGNTKFKSSKNTVPKVCENGELGEKKRITLKLKIISDLGLVGKPSAGKSTLISLITNAKAKVGDYDFTTLTPQLGLINYFDNDFVIADIPGLIENSAEGKGLGIRFIKHIERCKALVYVIDFGDENKNPIQDYEILKNELCKYNPNLLNKNHIIIANKKDLPHFKKHLKMFQKKYPDIIIVENSFLEDDFNHIKKALFQLYKRSYNYSIEEEKTEIYINFEDDMKVEKVFEGFYEVSGTKIIDLYNKIPLITHENVIRFNKKVKDLGLWDLLFEKGIQKGDTVRIEDYQFTWEEEN